MVVEPKVVDLLRRLQEALRYGRPVLLHNVGEALAERLLVGVVGV